MNLSPPSHYSLKLLIPCSLSLSLKILSWSNNTKYRTHHVKILEWGGEEPNHRAWKVDGDLDQVLLQLTF